jgi:cytochrome P450
MSTVGLAGAPPVAAEPLDLAGRDMLPALWRAFERHGDACRLYAPAIGRHVWLLSHPQAVRHVLVDNHRNYVKGVGIERVRVLLGAGLMGSEGERWRVQRKMIQPAFHRTALGGLVPEMRAVNERLLQRWLAAAHEGRAVDLVHDASEITLEIILRAVFGEDFDAIAGGAPNPFALLTEEGERNLAFAYKFRQLSSLILEVVRRRRATDRGARDFLSFLLAARDPKTREPMPERQLLHEVLTLIVAGHETTASALSWMWYCVAGDPPVEGRLHDELDALPESAPDEALPDRLPYAQQVVRETLRLYPPGWLLTRRALGPDEVAGSRLEAGDDVLLSPYVVHRHPALWRDPQRFEPERFAAGNMEGIARGAYFPFGLGPRACIGEQMAMLEMLVHLGTVGRAVRLRRTGDAPAAIEAQVNLRPRPPMMMALEARRTA